MTTTPKVTPKPRTTAEDVGTLLSEVRAELLGEIAALHAKIDALRDESAALSAKLETAIDGIEQIGKSQDWVAENAATARQQLDAVMSNGGGLGGLMKMGAALLGGGGKRGKTPADMNPLVGEITNTDGDGK